MNATRDMEASTLWLLQHNLYLAQDLLGILKRANKEVLIEDDFWIVQNDRKCGSVSFRHENLLKLCRMKFQTLHEVPNISIWDFIDNVEHYKLYIGCTFLFT